MGCIDFKKIEECGARAAAMEAFVEQLKQEQHFDIGIHGVGQRMYFGPSMKCGDGEELRTAILNYLKNRMSLELSDIMRETEKLP